MEHFVLRHVIRIVLGSSGKEDFSRFIDAALTKETLDLLFVSDLAHDVDF